MVSEADGGDSTEVTDDSTGKAARKIDQLSDAIKSKVDVLTPENIHIVQQSVKIAFTVVLTALIVYWGLAYSFDVVWFEF